MSDPKITYISQLAHRDITALDDASFYNTFDELWKIIKTPAYQYIGSDAPYPIQQKNMLEGLDIHHKFLVEMAHSRRAGTSSESFSKVWKIICDRSSEQPILDLMPTNQQFLKNLMSHNTLKKPVEAFSDMLKTIEFFKSVSHSRRPFPIDRALDTFEMLMDATNPQTRRSVFLEHGDRISHVHPTLFERLSVQVVKEKLLAQKEIQEGLGQAPAHSKM